MSGRDDEVRAWLTLAGRFVLLAHLGERAAEARAQQRWKEARTLTKTMQALITELRPAVTAVCGPAVANHAPEAPQDVTTAPTETPPPRPEPPHAEPGNTGEEVMESLDGFEPTSQAEPVSATNGHRTTLTVAEGYRILAAALARGGPEREES